MKYQQHYIHDLRSAHLFPDEIVAPPIYREYRRISEWNTCLTSFISLHVPNRGIATHPAQVMSFEGTTTT